jgi:uncharacterized protein (TIGR03437 family)
LIRDNQDFSILHPQEASDNLGIPPWLRVHWRRLNPDWSYSPDDPTGNYPRGLKYVYRWMLNHQDLKSGPAEAPEEKAAVVGPNLRISGQQTTYRSESNISVNYLDPMKIIAGSNSGSSSGNQAQFYSTDGGATWGQTTLPLVSSDLFHSDPIVGWTSDGRAWSGTLGIGVSGGSILFQGRAYVSTNNGQTWTFDGTFSGSQTRMDKPMMWIDHSPSSPYKDNIYVTYHNNQPAFMNRRTSTGWQTPIQVSGAETTGTGIGGDVKTNSAGDVFGFWPDTGSGKIFVVKSTDGGVSYSSPVQVATTFDTYDIGIPAQSSRRVLIYMTAGAYRTASKNLVYAAWNDLSGESDCVRPGNEPGSNTASPCKMRIWFSRSTDGGATWSPKEMINNQSGLNDQFNPWLLVDETSGNLNIIYYDTVGDPGRKKVNVWYQSSSNDGAGWNPPVKVTTAQTDETSSGADSGNQFGDYNGLSGINGVFLPAWTDRRNNAREEIWTAKITDNFTPEPFVMAAGATIACGNPTVLDPGKTVTVNFGLRNTGSANVGNLTATLLASGGVTSPSGPQNYGALTAGGATVSRPFTFTVNGTCGGSLTATLQLQDGATSLGTVTFTFALGVPKVIFVEDFDSVTAPALPPGWTSTVAAGGVSPWATSTTSSETPPNNAFHSNPNVTSDVRLETPSIPIASSSAQLSFSNNYSLEAGFLNSGAFWGFDGGVLEIAIGDGPFTDIIAAGGSFVTGGYDETIYSGFGNPLGGRRAWSGSSFGYIATVVNLPVAAAGQNIKLRWRLGSDFLYSFDGWRIDSVRIADGFTCATSVSPRSGMAGDVVRISGPNLVGATEVKFNNNVNASFTANGPTLITATVPAGAGAGPITISKPGCADTQTENFVVCTPITITPDSLPDGPVNTAYNRTLTASGGTGPYSFAVTTGTLPNGLTLSSAGAISGTPTRSGSFSFTVRATDANGCAGTKSYTLAITCPTVTITPATLPDGAGGVAYSRTLTASGVPGPFSFAVTSGSLPGGLTLSSGGVLSGTPNTAGAFNFTITATATASGCAGTRSYTVNIIVVAGDSSTITMENCSPTNGAIDPGERVVVNFSLKNNGPINTTNLVATLQATGGVTSPSGSQTYGALTGGGPAVTKSFTFTADPSLSCGGALTATLSLQDGTTNLGTVTFSFILGARTLLSENFDSVSAPTLPAGWTSSVAIGGAAPWITSTTSSDTAPNNAFVTNPGSSSDIRLDSPSITITSNSTRLSFRNNYDLEGFSSLGFDGGVLEIAIGAGPFTDILAAGGNFVTGGYNMTIDSTDPNNPLAGRRAWSGDSNGYITTTVNLPVAAAGQTIKLRWRMGSDNEFRATGWRIDTIRITEAACATSCGGPLCPTITINPATLPAGAPGAAYNQTLTASGGAAPYNFMLSGGTLPNGLTLSSAGVLSGTPTQGGSFNITVRATDRNGCVGAQSYSLTIVCPTITLAPATLPTGAVGVAYNQAITASGGASPYSFALSAGTLPNGLTLSSAGVLSGTPTQSANANITIRATDANGCVGTQSYSLVINCPTITLSPGSLPSGAVGAAYNQTIIASGGASPYSFTVSAGTLPNGLTLSSGGALSGTPTRSGNFNFTIRATDATGCQGARAYTLVINCVANITLSPGVLPNGVGGLAYNQTFTASGGASPYSFAVTSGTLPGGLTLSSSGVLSGAPNTAGAFNFTVTATDASGCTGTRSYTLNIIVIAGDGSVITAENCSPTNGAIDPGERVVVNFSLKNNGPINTTNLVATLQATGGVTSPSGPQTYGALTAGGPAVTKSFTFTADPSLSCGGALTATLSLQDGATNLGTATFNFTIGGRRTLFAENFDSVTAPALPAGWASTVVIGSAPPWVTSTTSSDTAPNNAFVTDPNSLSDIRLDSPSIQISSASAQLTFRNNYSTDLFLDGGVLEIAIGAGAFTDILAAGGSFVTGGYNDRIAAGTSGPLNGRQAWTGDSNGYLTTTVNLPPTVAGQTIKLRWRMGSSVAWGAPGWRIDTITITESVCATSCGGTPCPQITINPSALPAGLVGVAYNQTFTQTGGAGNVTFSLSAGTLPTGLTLSSAGALSGTPTQSGNFNITVKATDANGCMGTRDYTLVINSCPAIMLSPATLPSGVVGAAYNQVVSASPASSYTFAVTAGALPAGLSLNPTTGAITGTPAAAGAANFTITATGPGPCSGSQAYTLTINNPTPNITGLSPNTRTAGSAGFKLTINGSNFVNGAVAQWNGNNRTTTFVSSSQLMATIPYTDIINEGAASITVINPAPAAGPSNASSFNITQPVAGARTVRVTTATGSSGANVVAPIELVSQGDENAIGFSLTFDPAVLSNPQVALGSDAAGATLNTNASQASQGRYGVTLSLPGGQTFGAGARKILNVSFTIAANTSAPSSNVGFGDQPVSREISDPNASPLPSIYTPGAITITQGVEADVAPRPTGNGSVTTTDWVQVGRFVAGVDTAAAGSEFQRADCAPRDTLGDGRLTVTDWVQAGRYATANDPLTPAGGPTAPSSPLVDATRTIVNGKPAGVDQNQLRHINAFELDSIGRARRVAVSLDARGDENALGFSLLFNPSQWRFVSAIAGRDVGGVTLHVNVNEAARGRIGLAIALPAGQTFDSGAREIVILQFAPRLAEPSETALAIGFGDQPVAREIVTAEARALPGDFTFTAKAVRSIAIVSAASLAGDELAPDQIVTVFGERLAARAEMASVLPLPIEIGGARVIVTDSAGVARQAPLFFVSPQQINFLIPAETAIGTATITIIGADGEVSVGVAEITESAPGLFAANSDGQGAAAAIVLRVRADGARSFEPAVVYDSARNRLITLPIDVGAASGEAGEEVFLILFGTGLGAWSSDQTSLAELKATVGAAQVEVTYAGPQGEFAGLDQINLRLPGSMAGSGEVEVALTINGKRSNAVRIRIK